PVWLQQAVAEMDQLRVASSKMAVPPGAPAAAYFRQQTKKAEEAREKDLGGNAQMALNAAIAPQLEDAVSEQATAQISEYDAEFRVPGKVNLKSSNDATKLFIPSVPMASALGVRITPRLVTRAFLFAKVKNNEDYPLIPGMVAKYRDGSFIGNAS